MTKASPSSTGPIIDAPDLDLRLIRKAESVILNRSNLIVVVERCTNDHNYSAILRTAEALGIQTVHLIEPLPENNDDTPQATSASTKEQNERKLHHLFAQNATEWLDVVDFSSTAECVQALRAQGYQIWATDLSQQAVPLTTEALDCSICPLPERLAIVFGTEAVGVSQEMLEAADLRVYLPLRGFADSLNLSVATALVLHNILLLEPSYIGNLSEASRDDLRRRWFPKLARQRLLSSAQKKRRKKLMSLIKTAEKIRCKLTANEPITNEQAIKLENLPELRQELQSIESQADWEAADDVVADFIAHPPAPLSDLRRANVHRITFVGKNTKKINQERWKDMAATSYYKSEVSLTASLFRHRVEQLKGA